MHSPFLADPGADKHGKVVFYDVFGLFSVVYPERIALIINTICSVASLVNIYFAVSRTDRTRSGKDQRIAPVRIYGLRDPCVATT